ncbi:DUF2244 domain-containing protein [Arenimonas sp.]|uniref:DUF2244 domain-containing protein n=1 Tax=Arenimonas sp. TaxID=1872635 RepID=UPI0039E6003F
MIEQLPSGLAGTESRLLLRPRCALTGSQFAGLFALLAALIWAPALLGYRHGNAYAPAFALLDCAIVAGALYWSWRLGGRYELIACGKDGLEVRRSDQREPAFRAHPYWTRLRVTQGDGEARVHLGSRGKEVEVGAFLAGEERRDLARRLKALLATAIGPPPITDHCLR